MNLLHLVTSRTGLAKIPVYTLEERTADYAVSKGSCGAESLEGCRKSQLERILDEIRSNAAGTHDQELHGEDSNMDEHQPLVVSDSLGHFLCNERDHNRPNDLDQEFQGITANIAEHSLPRAKYNEVKGQQHFAYIPKDVGAELSDGGVGDATFLVLDRALEPTLHGHGAEVEGSGKD
jgi:hypothetical protein